MKEYENYTDEDLVGELKRGNLSAFDFLYRKYAKRLYKFAYSILKSDEEAENIVQYVYVGLWENRGKIEKGQSLKYYIFTIAYNSSISVLRKRIQEQKFREHIRSLQIISHEPVSLEVEFNDLNEKFNEIIDHLPKRQKEVYLLHRQQGLKYSEIAARLGISQNTIENHMSRALKTLRKKFGPKTLAVSVFLFLFL